MPEINVKLFMVHYVKTSPLWDQSDIKRKSFQMVNSVEMRPALNSSSSQIASKRYNTITLRTLATYQTIIPNPLRSEVAAYTTIKINL
jgi:hypothetical protein